LFESAGKAVDESMTMAEAVRSGKLTRSEFDAWYAKRTSERAAIIVNLRATTNRLLEPLEDAFDRGRAALRASPPPRRARRHRPAARAASNLSERRK
jgi:hypothetical protein